MRQIKCIYIKIKWPPRWTERRTRSREQYAEGTQAPVSDFLSPTCRKMPKHKTNLWAKTREAGTKIKWEKDNPTISVGAFNIFQQLRELAGGEISKNADALNNITDHLDLIDIRREPHPLTPQKKFSSRYWERLYVGPQNQSLKF